MTDEAGQYGKLGDHFAPHEFTVHSAKEYVRGEVHTNTVEGYHSIFERGMKGVYQHCAEKYLHRCVADFDFRYKYRVTPGSNDAARPETAPRGIAGKRLAYRQSNGEQNDAAARSAGFIAAIRELGCDEPLDAFEAAARKVARHKPMEDEPEDRAGPKT